MSKNSVITLRYQNRYYKILRILYCHFIFAIRIFFAIFILRKKNMERFEGDYQYTVNAPKYHTKNFDGES